MNMKKVVFFETKPWEVDYVNGSLKDFEVEFCEEKLTAENVEKYADAEVISSFIGSTFTSEVLSKLKSLKMIATRSTGYDHIDLDYCKNSNILVSNVPSYGENTVAEHAMALLLSLSRRIPESIDRVRANSFIPEGLTGRDLKGKVMGVLGTGHIGKNMIAYSLAFGMKVLAYDLYPDEKFASEAGFSYAELDYLFAKADVISLHLPYTKETHHVINKEAISKMKKDVVIINTARGGLIETDALFDGLSSGKVGGAGLDVLEEEKFLSEEVVLLHMDNHGEVNFKVALENHMMAHLPNVIITPHNAFNSKEALERIITTTIDNVKCYFGGSCKNLVAHQ